MRLRMGFVLFIASHIGKAGKKGGKSCEDVCDHFHPREIAYNAWVCMYLNNITKYLVFVVLGFLVNFSMEAGLFFQGVLLKD